MSHNSHTGHRPHLSTLILSGTLVLACALTLLAFATRPHAPEEKHEVILTPLNPEQEEVATTTPEKPPFVLPPRVAREYVEIIEGCGPYFDGPCVNVRSGPGATYPARMKLRMGAVVEVDRTVLGEDGLKWYRIKVDSWLRYPERVRGDMYIAAPYVRSFVDDSAQEAFVGYSASTTKRLLIDRSEQMLYAYDGDTLVFKESISTGIKATPTPRGYFTVYKKTPSRYMQGPIPGVSAKEYDLLGVPWNLYFTAEGAVVHGAFWHNKFGTPYSNGCVNLPPTRAQAIYAWAELGMPIVVRD